MGLLTTLAYWSEMYGVDRTSDQNLMTNLRKVNLGYLY